LGERNSVVDAQIIQIFYNILKELKIKDILIEINTIGDFQCRPYYKKLLVSYLKNRENLLCSNCKKRLKDNPLRILDCKEEKCQKIASQAPQMVDHLCEECKNHFKEVLEFLDDLELPYSLNPYLVRGLDYYTKTVFEIYQDSEEGKKQGTLAAGGRYDKLVKLLGGRDAPACGGGLGIERLINIMKSAGISFPPVAPPRIFLAQLGMLPKRKSLKIFENFRKAKIPVAEALSKDSLKTQLRIADKMGVDYTLILGQKEIFEGLVILREMKTGKQETIKLDKLVETIKKRLKK
jgi:histidyl-tRNA synthetase